MKVHLRVGIHRLLRGHQLILLAQVRLRVVDYLRRAARLPEEVHQAHLLTVDHLQVAVHLLVAAHPNHRLDQDLG